MDLTRLDTKPVLKRLLGFNEGSSPLLAAYLDVTYHNEDSPERLRLFLKNRRTELMEPWRVLYPARTISQWFEDLETFIDGLDPAVKGLAYFRAVDAEGETAFQVHFESPIPFENDIRIQATPYITPLIRLSENHETCLATLLDSRSARILQVALNQVVSQEWIDTDVPGWNQQGGWSQLRIQHHIQEHKEIHYKRVAEALTREVDTALFQNIFLLGDRENVTALKRHLPERVLTRIAQTMPYPMYETNGQVLRVLEELVRETEEEKEVQAFQAVVDTANAGGLATVVLSDILDGVRLGQIDTLFVRNGTQLLGLQCRGCGRLELADHSILSACQQCGEVMAPVSLLDELVLGVKRTEGSVDFVASSPAVSDLPQLAARLRFK